MPADPVFIALKRVERMARTMAAAPPGIFSEDYEWLRQDYMTTIPTTRKGLAAKLRAAAECLRSWPLTQKAERSVRDIERTATAVEKRNEGDNFAAWIKEKIAQDAAARFPNESFRMLMESAYQFARFMYDKPIPRPRLGRPRRRRGKLRHPRPTLTLEQQSEAYIQQRLAWERGGQRLRRTSTEERYQKAVELRRQKDAQALADLERRLRAKYGPAPPADPLDGAEFGYPSSK